MRTTIAGESNILLTGAALLGAAGLGWWLRIRREERRLKVRPSEPLAESSPIRLASISREPVESLKVAPDDPELVSTLRHERDQAILEAGSATAEANLHRERIMSLELEIERLAAEAKQLTDSTDQRVSAAEAERDRVTTELHSTRSIGEAADRRHRTDKEDLQTRLALLGSQLKELRRHLAEEQAKTAGLETQRLEDRREADRLVAKVTELEQARRADALADQVALASLRQQLGKAQALAERVEPLLRQVEDREGLVRSIALERDHALLALAKREAELRDERDARAAESRQLRTGDAELAALKDRLESLERQLSKATRERDDLAALERRARIEIESFRAEIKERDVRFRALLADRRHLVESGRAEAARLRELVAALQTQLAHAGEKKNPVPDPGVTRSRSVDGDDLTRISGIGVFTARLLKKNGITTFRQIAVWTDQDINLVAGQLKGLGHRIRRERWIEQARREHERAHGESLDATEREP